MEQGFFTNLPSEMTINILSRLPARNATRCKSVCKPWLHLLESKEFAESHISRSVPGLALMDSGGFTMLEFGGDHAAPESLQMATSFRVDEIDDFVLCSTNGLLLLSSETPDSRHGLWICNPITRESVELLCPNPKGDIFSCCEVGSLYGFGASKISGQLKVVKLDQHPQSEAHVYVLGTGSWRRIASDPPFYVRRFSNDVFVNGKLHWQVRAVSTELQCIYTFDQETEVFGSFVSPPLETEVNIRGLILGAVGDSLAVCANTGGETAVWVMKEYGDEKSWSKELLIGRVANVDGYRFVSPVVTLRDGEILVVNAGRSVLYYTRDENRGWRLQHETEQNNVIHCAVAHTSTFLSLRTFQMERVRLGLQTNQVEMNTVMIEVFEVFKFESSFNSLARARLDNVTGSSSPR